MNLDAEDLLAEIKHTDPELYERAVLSLQVRILTADVATKDAELTAKDAEIDRLNSEVDRLTVELERQPQLPARTSGQATPFPGSYPLVGEGGTGERP